MNTMDFNLLGAEWVWNQSAKTTNSYVRFIQDFDCENIVDARLLISADTEYVAYINGHLAGYGQYDDYPFYKVYNEHDIVRYLKKGKNRICILGYYQGQDSSQYYKADAGIIFAIAAGNELLATSGEDTFSSICLSYVSGNIERISPQLGFTFKYNASVDDYWTEKDSKPYNFTKSKIVKKELLLYKRPIKELIINERTESSLCAQGLFIRDNQDCAIGLLMQNDYLSSRLISEISDGPGNEIKFPDLNAFTIKSSLVNKDGVYLVFDLHKEEVGLLDFEIETSEGTVFDIGYGEHLDDLRVRSHVGGRNFACRYVSSNGRQRFTHYMNRIGCRYLQFNISNIKEDVKIYYAGVLPVFYPLKHKNAEIKDKLHQEIYNVAVRTLEMCMHEHYEDCPWREQALYAMDSRNQALCGYYSFEEYDFPESCIRLFAVNLNEDGLLELCAPSRLPITIPSFTFLWVLELYEFWKHSGRIGFVRDMFEVLKNICNKALTRIDEGLVTCFQEERYWNFYEWANGLDGDAIFRDHKLGWRVDAPINMFIIIALECAVQMANEIGEKQLAQKWSESAEKLRENTNEVFLEKESGLYYTYFNKEKKWHHAELTQALAICSGCAIQDKADNLRKILTDKNNGLVPTTLSYMAFKYDALLMDVDNYKEWVFDDIAKIWGGMLFKGATSFWETEKGACDFDNAGSLCHGWSAIPAYYYHKFFSYIA